MQKQEQLVNSKQSKRDIWVWCVTWLIGNPLPQLLPPVHLMEVSRYDIDRNIFASTSSWSPPFDNSVVFSVCLLYDDAMISPQCYQCDSAIDGADVCSADDNSPATGNLKDCPPEENKGCYIVEGEDGQIKRVHLNDNWFISIWYFLCDSLCCSYDRGGSGSGDKRLHRNGRRSSIQVQHTHCRGAGETILIV